VRCAAAADANDRLARSRFVPLSGLRAGGSRVRSGVPPRQPFFTRLLGAVTRPTAVLARAADWSQRYFAGGAGTEVTCTRCAALVPLRRYEREAAPGDAAHRHGLLASCDACGEKVSSSLGGLVTTLPQVRSLRREHARTVVSTVRAVEVGGTRAFLTEVTSVGGSAGVAAFYSHQTLRLLDVR
jgi:hypothetical protein